MTTKAIAIARDGGRWTVHDLDLDVDEIDDLDSLVDALSDFGPGSIVAFIEEDDEYLGVVRLGPDDPDPRVFLSDRRALTTSPLAERLFADALPSMAALLDDDEDTPIGQAAPIGDLELLADLGTPAEALLELIAEEGMLPADLISAISERAGAGEIFDEVRG